MKWLYDFCFLIFALFSIPKFLVRLNQAHDSKELIWQRWGIFSKTLKGRFSGRRILWLHAVSVGEVMAARQWIQNFLKDYPTWTLALSATTPTGRQMAETLASDRVVVFYAPFDLSNVVRRFLNILQPKMIVLMETELWPNLISEASAFGIPIGIVNGRISPRSFKQYQLVSWWLGSILRKLSFCLVQSERDGEYFSKLGMPQDKIFCTGNMKFDHFGAPEKAPFSTSVISEREKKLVWVAGSTNWNEEEAILRVFSRLRNNFQNLQLILAPRHPEHLSKVIGAVRRNGFQYRLFSENGSNHQAPVLLIDRMGVLASLYSLADVVFVGGSFVRRGGQNPIEAACCRKPLLHGPNVFNFSEVYQLLNQNHAAFQVQSEEELFQKLKLLLEQPKLRADMGSQAWSVVQSMKGATARTLDYLSRWIELREQPVAVA
ncbi:MAG: hypothetical protein A3C35_07655 [Omnitrophica bacterium RIFCSPHIGHO2_02_FULL_46_11]|nr:MAG: hypothetical protein A3C35_07655 [Omnitrophica bacterium RIFCSPHIGHO2_02_FULL_46_11]OGW87636.1 MAG: hypothetical protein A3A81_04820 [Omnitrophica bacterium RIFCSPLOWO2_01_FULL_45_10b]